MESGEQILIQKLDEFIRRYYKNQLIKGSLYAGGILLSAFLTVVLLEYFGEFNSLIRAVLFFTFLGAVLIVLARYIALPLLKLNNIGERITYHQAASIIGSHFSSVQDKLLNVLQLQNNQGLTGSDELLLAGIHQKINELRPVPFATAIDLKENRKYLRYVGPVVAITFLMLILWPQIFRKSTERLVHYSTYYEKEMPFTLSILNPKLEALQTGDFVLQVSVKGEQLPGDLFIHMNGLEYKLEKSDKLNFSYTFSNLQNSFNFQLGAGGFLSKEYHLSVLPKPTLQQFNLQLIYPAYLHKPNEQLTNTGDLRIPQGTKVNWVFNTTNTEHIHLRFMDSLATTTKLSENQFGFARRFLNSNAYTIRTSNSLVLSSPDSVSYAISVIPDQFPVIDVNEQVDSLNPKNVYFSGHIQDDYGFSNLFFAFTRYGTDTSGKPKVETGRWPVAFAKNNISQTYYYYFDAAQYTLSPGEKVEYYFEVLDNDGVNGPKSSKSRLMVFKAPTKDEINETTSRNNSEIKKDLEESISKARQLQKDINELSKKINDKKQPGYDEKKKLEDLLKKQQELQNKINEIKQENEQNNKQQSEFSQTDESIMEKQKQLEELFENVMTPEMKKLFDELNKMLDKMDKNQVQEKLEELKLSNKDIEKELDRNLEAFKQLEVQQKMQNAIEKLQELKDKQENLNKETEGRKESPKEENKAPENSKPGEEKKEGAKEENKPEKKEDGNNKDTSGKEQNNKEDKNTKKPDAAELTRKQDEIKKEFEELRKDLKDLEQKNKELEDPNKLPDTGQKQEETSKDMQNSSDQLSKNNKKAASKSQKSAAEKMEEMQKELEQAMEQEEEQQAEEDARALRQILENLLHLSFSQEELINTLPTIRIDNPKYVEIPKQQSKLKDDSKIIEDSLLALSKRVPKISATVNREISSINANMDKTVKSLAERNVGESTVRMQTSMTSINNLALLLSESLDQMQQQMKQQMQSKSSKSGKCKKPGSGSGNSPSSKGKPKAGDMRKLQEQLNQQLQQLKEALEKGQKPGDKPGDKKGQKPGGGTGKNGNGGFNMPGSSEQFAKLAAQQEALRRQMESMMSKLKNKGKNPGGDIANLMEETEKELVNKQLSTETMRRQQEILSRLLESEKAEKEREQDEQRKSNEAKNQNLSNPEKFLEYKRLKEKEMELLNTVPPGLTPYYKEKVNSYFNSVNKP